MGPTQPPIQWVPGALSPGVKRQGSVADHSPPSSAEVKNGGAIPPLPHMSSWHIPYLIKQRENFIFYLYIYLSVALQPFVGPWPLSSFWILYTVGRIPWTGDQSVARPLPILRTTQTQNECTQTFLPRIGLEPTIPVFERAKTVHASDLAETVSCSLPLRN
jgi:hypothetical protein